MGKRKPYVADPAWQQLELQLRFPEQRTYEQLRPVVVSGMPVAQRARETGLSSHALHRAVERFNAQGMHSVFEPISMAPLARPRLPLSMQQYLADLRAQHPPLNIHELATICYLRFGRRPGAPAIKRALAEVQPQTTERRFPHFHETPDPAQRRKAIIRLHIEGWNAKSVAAYLGTSRETVHRTLRRWAHEGVEGLANKSRAPRRPKRKVTFAIITTVRRLQYNPSIGAFRIQAALRQEGILLSLSTCSRVLALNRDLYRSEAPRPVKPPPKAMPFAAQRRHQYWSVDIRYLDMHQLGGGQIYCISILENYSRAILASGLSRLQDTAAYLMVLYAALQEYGAPEAIVSDHGSVFRAKQVQHLYAELGITRHHIAKRQPWQSYIETAFNVQRRMADWEFRHAPSWAALLQSHETWVINYNFQQHWAHRTRQDKRHSPADVLAWVRGRLFTVEALQAIFTSTRAGRSVGRAGYLRFRHWRIYGEAGLAGNRAAIWLYGETLSVTYANTIVAQYEVTFAPDKQQIFDLTKPHLFATAFQHPQEPLWEFSDEEWLKVLRLSPYSKRRVHPIPPVVQTSLPLDPDAATA
jgi:transposase InsO family protein